MILLVRIVSFLKTVQNPNRADRLIELESILEKKGYHIANSITSAEVERSELEETKYIYEAMTWRQVQSPRYVSVRIKKRKMVNRSDFAGDSRKAGLFPFIGLKRVREMTRELPSCKDME